MPLFFCAALWGSYHAGVVEYAGRPIPGATVTASSGTGKVITITDENGMYAFDLDPGDWKLEVALFGFETLRRDVKVTNLPTSERWELSLRPRAARPAQPADPAESAFQTVEAHPLDPPPADMPPPEPPANAGGADESLLVSGSLTSGLEISPKEKEKEERAGGPAFDLSQQVLQANAEAALNPGTANASAGGRAASGARKPAKAAAAAAGGRRASMAGAFIGKKTSGGARTASTFGNRRGKARDNIRGSAYLTLRDSTFDARPYSLSGQKLDKPSYGYRRFGVSLGGPLRIPKIVRSDGTFFYFDYNGTRSHNPYNAVSTLPTPEERAGDFSQSILRLPVTIYDPNNHQPFAGNRIPASRMNAASLGLLKFMPVPNQPGRIQNYQYVTSIASNTDAYTIRGNQRLSRYSRFAGSVGIQRRLSDSTMLYGFRDGHNGNGLNADLTFSHTFSPRVIFNTRFNLNRNRNSVLPFFAYGADVAGMLGIPGTSRDPANFGPPNLSFTNFGGLNDGSPTLRRDQTAGVTEGLTLVRKRNSFQLGAEFKRSQLNSRVVQNGRGSFSFSGLLTSALDSNGYPVAGTGFDFADFLLGLPQSSSIRFGSDNTYFRESVAAAYIQDDWKVRPNVSISLGFRWDYFTPFQEKTGRMANLDIAQWFTGVAVVTPGRGGPYTGAFPAGLINPDRNNFSPRLGLAWKPKNSKRLTVRAGYGIYYNGSIYSQFATRLASQPPFATAAATLSTSVANPLSIQNGFAAAPTGKITNTYAVDRYYRVGYAQSWNLSIQQELPRALVLEAGYLATKGTKLDIQRYPNRAAPGSPLTAEQRRMIGNATGFVYESSEGTSIYNAGQLRITRRFRKGLSANVQYAYGKTIDNASTFGGGGTTVAQNEQNLHLERGLSSFDQRHSLTAQYVITSPVGEGAAPVRARGMTGRLLKDWTLSGGVTARSGTPLTARVLGNRADSGGTGVIGAGRAEATGLAVTGGDGRFFNLAAFGLPPVGRYGNAGRNTIPGPGFVSMNLSFGRSFRLSEQRRVDFRVDSANFMNHANFTNVGVVVNALNYGLPTSAGAMRSMNATLRVRF